MAHRVTAEEAGYADVTQKNVVTREWFLGDEIVSGKIKCPGDHGHMIKKKMGNFFRLVCPLYEAHFNCKINAKNVNDPNFVKRNTPTSCGKRTFSNILELREYLEANVCRMFVDLLAPSLILMWLKPAYMRQIMQGSRALLIPENGCDCPIELFQTDNGSLSKFPIFGFKKSLDTETSGHLTLMCSNGQAKAFASKAGDNRAYSEDACKDWYFDITELNADQMFQNMQDVEIAAKDYPEFRDVYRVVKADFVTATEAHLKNRDFFEARKKEKVAA